MSAINTFAFQNILCVPQTRCAWPWVFAEETMQRPHVPVVTARWQFETDKDGNRRLVRYWKQTPALK